MCIQTIVRIRFSRVIKGKATAMAKIGVLAKGKILGITSHWVKLAVLFYSALSIFGLLLPTRLELIFRSTSHAISNQVIKPS